METEDTAIVLAEGALTSVAQEVEAGMPQLDFSVWPNLIFWLILTLLAIYMILSRVALPRIGAVLAERQGSITNDIAAAEELKMRAGEAERAYDKALADARTEAGRIVGETKTAMKADLDAAMAQADRDIAAQTASSETRIDEIRAGARQAVDQVARETALAIVDAFGGTADQSQVDQAVTARMEGQP